MTYQHLRTEVIQSSHNCSVETLNTLKHIFAERVDSARRLDNIFTVVDLLTILEKRNIQDEYLIEILVVLNTNKIQKHSTNSAGIAPLHQISRDVIDNTYCTRTINDLNQSLSCSVSRAEDIPPRVYNRKEKYDPISNELASIWKGFAQSLGLTESTIQQIEDGDKLMYKRARKALSLYRKK